MYLSPNVPACLRVCLENVDWFSISADNIHQMPQLLPQSAFPAFGFVKLHGRSLLLLRTKSSTGIPTQTHPDMADKQSKHNRSLPSIPPMKPIHNPCFHHSPPCGLRFPLGSHLYFAQCCAGDPFLCSALSIPQIYLTPL